MTSLLSDLALQLQCTESIWLNCNLDPQPHARWPWLLATFCHWVWCFIRNILFWWTKLCLYCSRRAAYQPSSSQRCEIKEKKNSLLLPWCAMHLICVLALIRCILLSRISFNSFCRWNHTSWYHWDLQLRFWKEEKGGIKEIKEEVRHSIPA